MDRQVDSLLAEISKHAHALDLALSTQARAKSKPAGAKDSSFQAQSPSLKDPHQEKKVSELIKSNDQLYSELRKTNERYLNQRVENAKLKDEIQILQGQLEAQ